MKIGVDYTGVGVVFICHDGEGNFLLGKRSQNCRDEQGTYEFGGGKLEFGETPEQAVLREAFEEYGVNATIDEMLPPFGLFRENNGVKTHWIMLPHILKANRLEAKNNEPKSIDEIGWFKLNNLPSPLHSGAMQTAEQFKEFLKKYS